MSFVTTQPEALTAAANALQTLGTSMAAENTAAAGPTTGIAPAAADPVSALQAAQFTAYGTWYQQVSAKAAAIHQMLVNTLGTSAGSYGETEAANQTSTGSTSLSGLLGGLTGSGTSSSAVSGAATTAAADPTTGAAIGTPFNWFQNVGAASSDFIALGQGQFLPKAVSWTPLDAHGALVPGAAEAPFMPTAPLAPATAEGVASAPVSAGVGQASSLGGLSVPPSWAAAGVPAANSSPVTLTGAGGTSAAPQTPPVTTMPAGVPSVASAGRGGLGFGAPRYGVKPNVMPKPTVV
ncbi:MAG TPA: PE domain-containing protein [Mycobacterium sp.]|nr:PE domain-containing protein [Mycobacterium sp.]